MVTIHHYAAGAVSEEPAQALFQRQWQLYRKAVDCNYLYHRKAYECLHRILVDEVVRPFRFLDIACGDASATVKALQKTQIASYHGIDLCQAALKLASQALETLTCPVTLARRDFVEALNDRPESVDVARIGLWLHHLMSPAKLNVMRKMRKVVGDQGIFLIYENASPDGEDRDAWLRRWDEQKPRWTELAPEEWEAGVAHVHIHDFPETTSRWHALGREAGFSKVRELFVSPTDLFRVYCFRA